MTRYLILGFLLLPPPTLIAGFPSSGSAPARAGDTLITGRDGWAWPTEAGRVVTSTFGEYRREHFHAGIDISSGDMTGYKVYAADDGYVARISISATGYGKMLQVHHPDGYTTVYAHLQKFAPAIDARASAEQQTRERYPVDIDCTPSEFPVHQGEVIAFSGSTGTGSPHLHFEVRDEQTNPLNPFLWPPLRVVDTIAPTITKIAASPLRYDATVDGRHEPRVYVARSAGRNRFRISAPIVLAGPAGLAVAVRDRIPGSRFRNGVYTNTLAIDGHVCYSVRLDRTPGRRAHEIALYYDRFLLSEGRGRFEKLYMNTPNDLPFYSPHTPLAGTITESQFAQGPHAFSITCSDFNGNSAEISGTFIISRPPAFSATRLGDDVQVRLFEPADVRRGVISTRRFTSGWSDQTWTPRGKEMPATLSFPSGDADVMKIRFENLRGISSNPLIISTSLAVGPPAGLAATCEPEGDNVCVRVISDGVITSPRVTVVEGERQFAVVTTAEDESRHVGRFHPDVSVRGYRRVAVTGFVNGRPAGADAGFDLSPIAPGTKGTLELDGGRLRVAYDSLSLLTPLFLWLRKSEQPEGTVYTLGPEDVVLGDGITITLQGGPDTLHRALFYREGGRWELIGGLKGDPSSGRITRTLGDVALLTDDTPPSLSRLSIGGTSGRKPRITFRFSDDLSGVEYNEVKVYIDNHAVVPDIDGEHHRAVYQTVDPLGRGSHQLTIRLKDRMGNSTTVERRFVLR